MANKLETMLREAQDYKSQYYVGTRDITGDIYHLLRKFEDIENNPLFAARRVNKRLQKKFGDSELSYLATPERVAGILKVFRDAQNEANKSVSYHPGNHLGIRSRNLRVFHPDYSGIVDSSVTRSTGILFPYFEAANDDEVTSDSKFVISVTYHLKRSYKQVREKMKQSRIAECDEWLSKVLENLGSRDWDRELSKDAYNEYVSWERRFAESSWFLTSEIFERMRNDRVLNRWEYQKQVLCKFLTEHEIKCYEQAVLVTEKKKELFKRNKMPTSYIDFIIDILRQRRSFVEGYLGS